MANYLVKPKNKKSTAVERVCKQCKNIFYCSPSAVTFSGAKFCTKKCKDQFNRGENSYAWKPKPTRICKNCNQRYEIEAWRLKEDRRGQFCTAICQREYRIGSNAPNWKGGVTKHNKRIRSRKEILTWRTQVLKRDNYRCIWCGETEGLEADHIKSFASYPELRTDVNNGRTLCRSCHIKTFTKVVV